MAGCAGEKILGETLKAIQVDAESDGLRIDQFLARCFPDYSRSLWQKLVKKGVVTVDGTPVKPRAIVHQGERIDIDEAAARQALAFSPLSPVAMDLDILWEDQDLIVLNKSAGLVVHPGAGDPGPTLVHGLLDRLDPAADWGELGQDRPGIVHRLDRDTTGVMVVAKNPRAHAHLSLQFKDKTSQRIYLALLDGRMRQEAQWQESYLERDPRSRLRFRSSPEASGRGKLARSLFTRLEVFFDRVTLAQVELATGRTHQIRVHAKDIGLGVVGDPVYHHRAQWPAAIPPAIRLRAESLQRQMLHAWSLRFHHPRHDRELSFEAPLPTDFADLVADLRAAPH